MIVITLDKEKKEPAPLHLTAPLDCHPWIQWLMYCTFPRLFGNIENFVTCK
jgi:hypothetical protein